MKKIAFVISFFVATIAIMGVGVQNAEAVPGALLDTVGLAGNSGCNVGIAFDGAYVMTIDDGGCFGQEIGIHTPGTGALVATKTVRDAAGALVDISAIDWDSSRGKLWATYNGAVYLVDIVGTGIGVTEDVVATFEFATGVGGFALTDGLAWDSSDDTLYVSPDVSCCVYQFSLGTGVNPPLGTLMNTVSPENAAGVADGFVSGVAIGSGNTLYIGRNGNAEIRRVDKTTGAFVSTFATTAGRVEDLVCDPVTYAPLEAILAKDAFSSLYEAFEVETGTCPLPVEPTLTLDPSEDTNPVGTSHTVTATIAPVVQGALVSFSIVAGPNAGQVSDPGECSVDLNCNTDANAQTSWTYTSNGAVGTDTIQACFIDESGAEHCATAEKTWVDKTPPKAACIETVNPHGQTVPPAGKTTLPGPKGGQNEDGYYELLATDNLPGVQIFVNGFGPFASDDKIKVTEAPGAIPSQKKIGSIIGKAGAILWHLILNSDPVMTAVDAAGNVTTVTCLVPPPPK